MPGPTATTSDKPVPQDLLRADSCLMKIRVDLAPIGNAAPSGYVFIIQGFPNTPKDGVVVGRTKRWLDRTKPVTINMRMPPAVRNCYIEDPYSCEFQLICQQLIAEQSTDPGPSNLDEMRVTTYWKEQPIEDLVL